MDIGRDAMGDYRHLLPSKPEPTVGDLLNCLIQQVDLETARLLEQGSQERGMQERGEAGLVISEGNRKTLLRMLHYELQDDRPLDLADAAGLISRLDRYLQTYMADQPEGHVWIIICCLFSAFIAGEPLHPQEATRWTYSEGEGYRCPAFEPGEDSLCNWCACTER